MPELVWWGRNLVTAEGALLLYEDLAFFGSAFIQVSASGEAKRIDPKEVYLPPQEKKDPA
jgi:hypothetical protein